MNITIPKEAFQAMLEFAPKSDTRTYLNSVMLEINSDGVRLVATDGHILGVWRDTNQKPTEQTDSPLRGQYIIPRDLIVSALASKSRYDYPVAISGNTVTISTPNGSVSADLMIASYPDYRIRFSGTLSGVTAQFDAYLLNRIQKAFDFIKKDFIAVHHNGDDAALVQGNTDALVAIIMPYRAVRGRPLPDQKDADWVRAYNAA